MEYVNANAVDFEIGKPYHFDRTNGIYNVYYYILNTGDTDAFYVTTDLPEDSSVGFSFYDITDGKFEDHKPTSEWFINTQFMKYSYDFSLVDQNNSIDAAEPEEGSELPAGYYYASTFSQSNNLFVMILATVLVVENILLLVYVVRKRR